MSDGSRPGVRTLTRSTLDPIRTRLSGAEFGRRALLTMWLTGLAIRVADVIWLRPICRVQVTPGLVTSERAGTCMPFSSDNFALFGAAQLIRHGKVGYNPLYYVLTGGQLAPTAAKPPVIVAYMAIPAWLGSAPLLLAGLVFGAVIGGIWLAFRRYGRESAGLLCAQVAIVAFIVLRLVGGETVQGIRLAVVLFTSAAIPLIAVYAKELGGAPLGLVAGWIVAVNPAIWVNDSMLNVEAAVVVAVPLLLLAQLYLWRTWRPIAAVAFGAACAFAVLSRFELIVAVLITGFATLFRGIRQHRQVVAHTVRVIGVAVLAIGGYLGWNLARGDSASGGFGAPLGLVMSQSACDQVLTGPQRGMYAPCMLEPRELTVTEPMTVADAVDQITGLDGYGDDLLAADNPARDIFPAVPPIDLYDGLIPKDVERLRGLYARQSGVDANGVLGMGAWVDGQVENDPDRVLQPGQRVRYVTSMAYLAIDEYRTSEVMWIRARDYLSDHASDLPSAMVVRVLRMFGLYKLGQSAEINAVVEGQGWLGTWGGLAFVWATLIATPFGLRNLRRHRVAVAPIMSTLAQVVAVAAATYGIMRYRLSWDVASSVLLGAAVVGYGLIRNPESEAATVTAGGTANEDGPTDELTDEPKAAAGERHD